MNLKRMLVIPNPSSPDDPVPFYSAPIPQGALLGKFYPQFARIEVGVDLDAEKKGYVPVVWYDRKGDQKQAWVEKTHLQEIGVPAPGEADEQYLITRRKDGTVNIQRVK